MQLSFWALLSCLGLALAAPVQLNGRGQSLNTFLDTILNNLPVLNCSIQKAAGILTAFENFLAFITFESTTYNQLNSKCKDYTVIFARGTTEPGNVGILVGPPFFKALTSQLGSKTLAIQGVNNYAATIPNYLVGGDPSGSQNMAMQIRQAYQTCPKTKVIAAGYSQGGQIVHNAIGLLDAVTASWISKVVIFGDPDNGKALPNVPATKVDTYCSDEDNICINGDLILPAHLMYGSNAMAAAQFVMS